MSDCFILLSAGNSKRFKSKINKQFISYKNRPLFEHSLKTAIDSNLFKKILLVSNKKILETGTSNLLFVKDKKFFTPKKDYYQGNTFKYFKTV